MSNHLQHDEYEDDVRAWLAPLAEEEALPDPEFLRELRERSATAFAAAEISEPSPLGRGLGEGDAAARLLPHPGPLPKRERGRWRRIGAMAAAAGLVGVALWLGGDWSPSAQGGVTLGDLLRQTAASHSLHLQVRHNLGQQAEVWVRDGERVRWEDAPGQYTIARGSQLWRIDEAANTALREKSPWSSDKGVDLVALLETSGNFQLQDAAAWMAATPNARGEYLGADCLAYEREFDADGGPIRVIAYADLQGRQLRGLVAWRRDARQGPPLAEVRLVARNVAVDEAKFKVAESLTEDGRIGKVLDVQGLVAVQPPLAQRWTPVCGPLLLMPGDWVRTETRGASAVRLALSSQVELTLGPGGLVELLSPTRVRVYSGEVQAKVASTAESAFTVLGKGEAREELKAGAEAIFHRADTDAALTRLEKKPRWLAGFEGSTSDESLGSLIATVDGKNVPLSVGYHKVGVDIRDQIARTVVEESFVNNTEGRLEGVFYFPLPADASISGFGMWIGGELVEADIVEKQRAREIYETILRERRDPGLLEWTSGNLFKARVFPIEPHSEKRVKIVYTQVLPLRDNRYVYSYGLRSELLRTRPLRELGINVRVASELPLRSVICPTHDVRVQLSEHAADVQFAAQEYAPTRDFEVVCEIDGRQSDVVVIPHQRGSDGYFLVQLTPPSPAGMWRRETLADGEPLELLLVCDTSGSMDSESRRQQRDFVAAALGSLSPNDRFNLAACDVDCNWALQGDADGEVASATGEHIEQALKYLDARRSLGWTDLDRTFKAVLDHTTDKTQVIYIGDGVPSAGDADPQALVARLRRLYDARPRGTFHAVGVGNLYEATVLKAIAGLGGGSLRHIGGEMSPQRVALELLREVTEPGVRDLKVEFSGVQVAAVYPERLPNLPAGAQQILVGRYLPQATEQNGELIVTGKRGDETVRYATRVRFPASMSGSLPSAGSTTDSSGSLPLVGRAGEGGEAGTRTTALRSVATGNRARLLPPSQGEGNGGEDSDSNAGNSFIPRLWARSHLDHLLAQGSSQAIQDEIISLSEQFHIITPYTSLLVLETDADRERFGVKRRFAMRDGERFFADGRDNANYELAQQQMRVAANWRMGLRQQILAGLAGLGRDAEAFQLVGQFPGAEPGLVEREIMAQSATYLGVRLYGVSDGSSTMSGPWGGSHYRYDRRGGFGGEGGGFAGLPGLAGNESFDVNGLTMLGDFPRQNVSDGLDPYFDNVADFAADELSDFSGRRSPISLEGREFDASWFNAGNLGAIDLAKSRAPYGLMSAEEMPAFGPAAPATMGRKFYAGARISMGQEWQERGRSLSSDKWDMGLALSEPVALRGLLTTGKDIVNRGQWNDRSTQWLEAIVPAIPVGPGRAKPQAAMWPAEAVEVARSLLRVEALRALKGGVEVRRTSVSLDPRWDRESGRSEQLELYSPTAWLTRPLGEGVHTVVSWCDAKERGAFSRTFELGRVRTSNADDRREIPLGLGDDSLQGLDEIYRDWNVRVERPAADRVVLALSPKHDPESGMRLTIDASRHVLVERRQLAAGKVVATTTFDDFVEVGGVWWARRVETRDADGAVTARATQSITLHTPEEFQARYNAENPSRAVSRGLPTPSAPAPALLIHFPLPSLQHAKQAVTAGSAGVEAHLVMLIDEVARQQWDAAFERLASIEELTPASPDQAWSGLRWIRIAVEQMARRNATVLGRLTAEAKRLNAAKHDDSLFLANHLLGVAGSIADGNEQLTLITSLQPVYAAQPEYVGGELQWKQRRVDVLQSLGRIEERLALHRELAAAVPWDAWRQIAYARDLASAGQYDAAYAWLQQELDRNPRRTEDDKNQLVFAYADLLNGQGRYADEADWLQKRVEQSPDAQEAYERYLSSLVFADHVAHAEELVNNWLKLGAVKKSDGKLTPSETARLQAAVDYACGSRRNLNVYRPEDKWLEPLAAVARRLATDAQHANIAAQIMNDWRFSDSDAADVVRGELFARLKGEANSLTPAQLSAMIGWVIGTPPETSTDAWRAIAAAIRDRWSRAGDAPEKDLLGQALVTIYANRFAESEYLPFLRARIDTAAKEYRSGYLTQLFEALVARPWSEETEVEAFGRLAQLSDADEAVDRLAVQLPALYRLVDRMIQARVEHDQRELQQIGHPEKLTRTDLAAKQAGFLKAAREGVAARLAMVAANMSEPLAQWLTIERLTLEVQLDRNVDDVAAACWAALGDAPPAAPPASDEETAAVEANDVDPVATARAVRTALLEGLYRGRALSLATYLAVRREAKPELVDRLVQFIDAGIAAGGDAAAAWRGAKFNLLVALDRPDDLQRELQSWIVADGAVSPWRAPLGRLLAERGQLAGAIGVFEAIRTNDNLQPGDLALLARWYLAVDRRADYERATVDAYMMADEYSLRQMIEGNLSVWRRADVALPTELDPQVLLVFEALLRKATSPGDYAWLLRDFYQACRDFRLLRMVPDAVIGRTPQQVYPFLESLNANLLSEVRDEAVADEMLGRSAELRQRELTPLDARALDLLEAMIQRRSSEVLNQPGPHADAAVAALRRTFRAEWADGEQLQMARLLAQLGTITAPALAEEQVRELHDLHAQSSSGSLERLRIAGWYAHALFWSHDRQDDALAAMDGACGEFDLARKGVWAADAIEPLEEYVNLLTTRSRFADAESALKRLGRKPATPQMANWFAERLDRVYLAALDGDGRTSLGSGEELYRHLTDHIDGELDAADQDLRYQLVSRLLEVYAHANNKTPLADLAKQDLRRFAFDRLPGLLRKQTSNYESLVDQTADRVKELLGPLAGIEFLVERMEAYPPWLQMSWNSAWQRYGSRLGQWRSEVGDNLGEAGPGLLRLVLAELRRDLLSRDSRNRYLYHNDHGYFWAAKRDVFANEAREILAKRRESGRAVKHIADYLYHGLDLRGEAIEALFVVHRAEKLDESGQQQLIAYLHETERFGESIALLEPLVERRPDEINYRAQLMTAYFRTDRPAQLRELLAATDKHFRAHGRWIEGAMAALADACRVTQLNREAVAYYEELIALVQRQQPGGGVGGDALSRYYSGLADSYSALGETEKAVDAAAGAVVSWGPRKDQRQGALDALRRVMTSAEDLDEYAAVLDRKAEESAADSPLLRKMLGEVLLEKGQHAAAETQLRAAIALDPTDLGAHASLVKCLDSRQKSDAAVEALLAWIDVDRRNLDLLGQLADRLADNEVESERATTAIVEASPQEAENHTALAQRRERKDRWGEAIDQWRHVARLRSREPDGLLKLATAQVHEKRWTEAAETLKSLRTTAWPARFGNLQGQILPLEQQVEAGQK